MENNSNFDETTMDYLNSLDDDERKKMVEIMELFKSLSPERQQQMIGATQAFFLMRSEANKKEKFYSIKEVCDRLKVSQRTVYRYIKDGSLKAVKTGKSWRISAQDLDDFLKR